jgi:hypothetical protein
VTVGPGIAPDLRFSLKTARGLALIGLTAGGDFHPALRVDVLLMPGAQVSRVTHGFACFSFFCTAFARGRACSPVPAGLSFFLRAVRIEKSVFTKKPPAGTASSPVEISPQGEFR